MMARRILRRDHFSRHYKPVVLCEWRAGEELCIVVCTVMSAGVHGGLLEPLASEGQYMSTFSFPTATTLLEGNVGHTVQYARVMQRT